MFVLSLQYLCFSEKLFNIKMLFRKRAERIEWRC